MAATTLLLLAAAAFGAAVRLRVLIDRATLNNRQCPTFLGTTAEVNTGSDHTGRRVARGNGVGKVELSRASALRAPFLHSPTGRVTLQNPIVGAGALYAGRMLVDGEIYLHPCGSDKEVS